MLYLACQNNLTLDSIPVLFDRYQLPTWIYLGDDTHWRIQVESVIPHGVERVSIASELEGAAGRLRQPYIDWIGDLSEKNQSPEWWASEIAAKNPYYMLFTRICLLDVAYKLSRDGFPDNTLIIGGTHALVEELAFLMNTCRIPWSSVSSCSPSYVSQLRQDSFNIAKSMSEALPPLPVIGRFIPLYQKLLEKHITYRQAILRRYGIEQAAPLAGEKTVLFFTWIDRRSFASDGSYTDPNFGPLPDLYKKKGYTVGFVPRALHTIPFEEAVIRLKKTGESLYFPEPFVTHADIKKYTRDSRSVTLQVPEDSNLQGIPLGSLAREHINQTRHLMVDNLLYHSLVQRMSANGTEPALIVHTCEGHSWENSLVLAVHTYMKKTKVLGYDNVTFSRLVLSMYPSKKELAFKPLPDYIVTNGPLFQNTLLKEGYDPDRIRCGCALRHTYLWKEKLAAHDPGIKFHRKPVKILVATAIGLGDSVELITKAARAFGDDESYQLIIKCHPMVNVDDVKRYLGSLLDAENISFSSSSIGNLLPDMDILLYTYTSVCYEAMMHGVYPVCVMPENFINLDKLDATPEIRASAVSTEDLRQIAETVVSRSIQEKVEWRTWARAIVRQALAPVDDSCVTAFFL